MLIKYCALPSNKHVASVTVRFLIFDETMQMSLGSNSGLKQQVYTGLISEINYDIVFESGVTDPLL